MTRFISTDAQLQAVLPELMAASSIALDTEFHSERWFYPRLMLLQLRADRNAALLIDPMSVSLSPLALPLSTKPIVVHGGQQDVQILHRLLGVVPNVRFDTQIAAGFVAAGYPVRLQALLKRFVGTELEKGETLSDWSVRPLNAAQLRYAAEDVLVLADLVEALQAAVSAAGHTEAVEHAVGEMVRSATTTPDDETAWRRVGGAHLLEDEERACLRTLVAWRDREARERDVPRHTIASDAILYDLARRRPTTPQEIRSNRRMPGHMSRQESGNVLNMLRSPGPAPDALPTDKAGFEVVRAISRVIERRTGVAGDLLLPDRDVHRLLSDAPTAWSALAPWRADLLGDDFRSLIFGNAGYTIPGELFRPAESLTTSLTNPAEPR
jgi:ribonuclease D